MKSQNRWDFRELTKNKEVACNTSFWWYQSVSCVTSFSFKKKCFCYNQLKFKNKVTLNKKLKQVVLVSFFFLSRQKKFIKLTLFLWSISIEMNQTFSNRNRCLNEIFLPSSCCSRNSEFHGTGVHDDGQCRGQRFWGNIRLVFKKENIRLKEPYPRVTRISAFPKLWGLGDSNQSYHPETGALVLPIIQKLRHSQLACSGASRKFVVNGLWHVILVFPLRI